MHFITVCFSVAVYIEILMILILGSRELKFLKETRTLSPTLSIPSAQTTFINTALLRHCQTWRCSMRNYVVCSSELRSSELRSSSLTSSYYHTIGAPALTINLANCET